MAAEKEEVVFKIKDLPPIRELTVAIRELMVAIRELMVAIRELMVAIRNPYTLKATHAAFAIPPKPEERVLATFCGT